MVDPLIVRLDYETVEGSLALLGGMKWVLMIIFIDRKF